MKKHMQLWHRIDHLMDGYRIDNTYFPRVTRLIDGWNVGFMKTSQHSVFAISVSPAYVFSTYLSYQDTLYHHVCSKLATAYPDLLCLMSERAPLSAYVWTCAGVHMCAFI